MPTAELEALFAKKAGRRWKLAGGKVWGSSKGKEGGRGPEEQLQSDQPMGREGAAKVEPAFVSQLQGAGSEHQHYYQQHQHADHLLPQQQVYPQSQQRIANMALDQNQQRLHVSSHAFLSWEDEQVQLALQQHLHYMQAHQSLDHP